MNNMVWKTKPCPICRTARWIQVSVDYVTGVQTIECLCCGRMVNSRFRGFGSPWDKWRDDEQIEEV